MKIYFSGSIKGGRQLVERYHSFIESLKNFGEVLTEHIGDKSYASNGYREPSVVYGEDVALISSANVVVADVTVPSLGVGYELAYAERLSVPCLCLYEKGANVSSMILGDGYFTCIEYETVSDAVAIIKNYLTKL